MESLGSLSPDAIKAIRKAKLLTLIRGSEVWVDTTDMSRAKELIGGIKESVEQVYRFSGFIVRMPKSLKLEQRYYQQASRDNGSPGRIHIHEYSKPQDGLDTNQNIKTLKSFTVKGEKIKFTRDIGIFKPSYSGVVMSDDNGVPIIEVTPWNIYVLFDTRNTPDATKMVYERQMLMFAIVLANQGDEKSKALYADIWGKQGGERESLEIKAFEDMFSAQIKKQRGSIEKSIKDQEYSLQEGQKMIFTATESLRNYRMQLEQVIKVIEGGASEKAREEWQRVKNMEKNGIVGDVKVTPEALHFTTRTIYWKPNKNVKVDYDGQYDPIPVKDPIPLGEFKVSVGMTRDFYITIKNIGRTMSFGGTRWEHPHIKEGHMCEGNMSEALPKFAASKQFEAVMMCVLKWLENVQHKDAYGKGVYYWVKDYKKAKAKKEKADEQARKKEEKKKKEEAVQTVDDGGPVQAAEVEA
jgi:hypothetical protein